MYFITMLVLHTLPPCLYQKIHFSSDIHNINVRRKSFLIPPAHKTATYEGSFTYNISKLYNKLFTELRKLGIKCFKKKLKSSLMLNQYTYY